MRPDVLRNDIVSGYVILYQINKFFVNTFRSSFFQHYFFIIDKMASRAG